MPIMEKLGVGSNLGKYCFDMKFNESRGIDHPFTVRILYDKIKEMPIKMEFIKFEIRKDFKRSRLCLHNCVQNRQVRFFIKYVPESVKPFSLKLTICPDCGIPIAYQFIVYPGDINMYPKVKDMRKFKENGLIKIDRDILKAIECPEYRIGVK